ncbi:aspartate aminotransferase family protein [Burkholderia gladioli]|uniref:aspartate aminotransferase family protein n=1 Tax=Burkholderia gladioli TaxID=28095 RepID=UPI00163EC80C|nr:aspartate aminotransferase family protein [Burkholderia gladioli]
MTTVFHRASRAKLPIAVAGDGIEIIDSEGNRYIDACSGAAVSCLGHSNQRVIDAIKRQAQELPYVHTSFFSTAVAEELSDRLVSEAPAGLAHVYFTSGGSEAIEAALKLARQYFVEKGQGQRRHFIARRQSYHGNTLGALAIGGNAWRREPFLPILIEAQHVSPCYAYREQRADETEEVFAQRLADELESTILELGRDSVAAFVAETVVGATAGAVPPVREYFKKIRAVCDKYGVLLILDEIMSGMGRTGHMYACAEDDVSPDILTIAKGLGAGYQAIGAMLVSDEIYTTLVSGSGFFQHGHTYIGHATACAAALEAQRVIAEDKLLDNVKARGEQLRGLLHAHYANHPYIGDIRGRGLFIGIELVQDRASKAPFDSKKKLHSIIKNEAIKRGLMVYPMGGTVDGTIGDHVLLAPPFITTAEQIDTIGARLTDAIEGALLSIGASELD